MREKTFIASTHEEIVGITYAPSKRLVIQVGVGQDLDGKFDETPEQNFENYIVENEELYRFENDPEIAPMINDLKLRLWAVIDATRDKIMVERDAKKTEQEIIEAEKNVNPK
jgi:hypothetical protein